MGNEGGGARKEILVSNIGCMTSIGLTGVPFKHEGHRGGILEKKKKIGGKKTPRLLNGFSDVLKKF